MIHVLTFDPIYKQRIWGGRTLACLFGRTLPGDAPIGESWDLADLPADESTVAAGPSAGCRLDELVGGWGEQLLGSARLESGRFPLLVKFLDANDVLSVQVHPDYASAAAMGGQVRAKYEAWYVIRAEPGACIYRGFKEHVTRRDVERAVRSDGLADLMVKYAAEPGQWFYLPGGTVHALGAALVVAEVQTPSDTTFRLYDWGRVDAGTGRPRDLHIDQALACMTIGQTARSDQAEMGRCDPTFCGQLVHGPTFDLSKQYMHAGAEGVLEIYQPVVWVILTGAGTLGSGAFRAEFRPGQVLLIPAGMKRVEYAILKDCSYLQVNLKPSH